MILTSKIAFVSALAASVAFIIVAALSGPLHLEWFP